MASNFSAVEEVQPFSRVCSFTNMGMRSQKVGLSSSGSAGGGGFGLLGAGEVVKGFFQLLFGGDDALVLKVGKDFVDGGNLALQFAVDEGGGLPGFVEARFFDALVFGIPFAEIGAVAGEEIYALAVVGNAHHNGRILLYYLIVLAPGFNLEVDVAFDVHKKYCIFVNCKNTRPLRKPPETVFEITAKFTAKNWNIK